jgi:hypothetical protein
MISRFEGGLVSRPRVPDNGITYWPDRADAPTKETKMTEPTVVSAAEAAKRIGLSAATLQKWRSSRSRQPLPFIRLSPRKIGYAVSVLDDFIRARMFVSTRDYDTAA